MFTPVILAGGNGVRLWPLSRRQRPKQFLSLLDDRSLLGQTLARLEGLETTSPIVICHEVHRFLAAEQLRRAGQGRLVTFGVAPTRAETGYGYTTTPTIMPCAATWFAPPATG